MSLEGSSDSLTGFGHTFVDSGTCLGSKTKIFLVIKKDWTKKLGDWMGFNMIKYGHRNFSWKLMDVLGGSWWFAFFESDMQYKLHYTSAAAFPWLVIYFILGGMVLCCFRFSESGKRRWTYLAVLYHCFTLVFFFSILQWWNGYRRSTVNVLILEDDVKGDVIDGLIQSLVGPPWGPSSEGRRNGAKGTGVI